MVEVKEGGEKKSEDGVGSLYSGDGRTPRIFCQHFSSSFTTSSGNRPSSRRLMSQTRVSEWDISSDTKSTGPWDSVRGWSGPER